eukprot:3917179-Amphidinium_carterae.1
MSSHGRPVMITSPRPVKRAKTEEFTQKVDNSVDPPDEKTLSQMIEEEIDTMREVPLNTQ